tara:strand:- start:4978 stop:5319 length:342 start_codon:yes stop_codon:yes gene_type:complete
MIKKILILLTLSIILVSSYSPGNVKLCQIMDKVPISNEEIVKTFTSFLPKADNIGHRILHLNEIVINGVLNYDNVPMEIKKPIVMKIIELSQQGDETGGMILQFYHDVINCLL